MYATLAWFRSHGVDITDVPDNELTEHIEEVSLFIDEFTGMWYESRDKVMILDGSGLEVLYLFIPIISISEIKITGVVVPLTGFYIYNRDEPDDRGNPKIVRMAGVLFPKKRQNIQITGKFGYTILGDSEVRVTPLDIVKVCRLLVLRAIEYPLEEAFKQLELDVGTRIKSEKTDKHSITFRDIPLGNLQTTGNSHIDGVLLKYKELRPRYVGWV